MFVVVLCIVSFQRIAILYNIFVLFFRCSWRLFSFGSEKHVSHVFFVHVGKKNQLQNWKTSFTFGMHNCLTIMIKILWGVMREITRMHSRRMQWPSVWLWGGGCLPGEGGVCLGGVCLAVTHPPCVDRMTGVKTIPCRNHVADGKNLGKNWLSVHTVERLDKSPCSFSSNTTKKGANDFSYTPTA